MTVCGQAPLGHLQLFEARELALGFEAFRLLTEQLAGSHWQNMAAEKLTEDRMAEGHLSAIGADTDSTRFLQG